MLAIAALTVIGMSAPGTAATADSRAGSAIGTRNWTRVEVEDRQSPPRQAQATGSGAELYAFYCYQCHGFAGDGATLAATYMDPKPRNFQQADPTQLTRERMLDAVTNGRQGTAMAAFGTVIDAAGRSRVVDYVRARLMGRDGQNRRYHTADNGWPDHERFAAAFPFATGTIALDEPWEALSEDDRQGRDLYLRACISCHDHGAASSAPLIWDLRPLSYPRRHYSHRAAALVSAASPYAVHDRAPDRQPLTPDEAAGQQLFEANCAFCHARDGSGRNWIGQFLEPHPRNLSGIYVRDLPTDVLKERILLGVPGTAMPAWREILDEAEVDRLMAYLVNVLAGSGSAADVGGSQNVPNPSTPSWRHRAP